MAALRGDGEPSPAHAQELRERDGGRRAAPAPAGTAPDTPPKARKRAPRPDRAQVRPKAKCRRGGSHRRVCLTEGGRVRGPRSTESSYERFCLFAGAMAPRRRRSGSRRVELWQTPSKLRKRKSHAGSKNNIRIRCHRVARSCNALRNHAEPGEARSSSVAGVGAGQPPKRSLHCGHVCNTN